MTLKRLVKMKNVAIKSFNGIEIEPKILSYYAMNIEEGEIPVRLYQASTHENDGMLLSTDKRLLFISDNEEGYKMGIDIPLDEIDHIESYVHNDKNTARLIVIVLNEGYEFDMLAFGVDGLVDSIKNVI